MSAARYVDRGLDISYPRPVIWVDPGTATGVTVVHFDLSFLTSDRPVRECIVGHYADTLHSMSEDHIADEVLVLWARWPNALVGTEDFILYGDKESAKGGRPLLSPVRINAKLQYAAYGTRRPLHYQPAALIERVTKEHLERAGVWWTGFGTELGAHAKDATSHALVFARRAQKDQGLRRLFLGEEAPK
jgi:hypothetical protein